MPLRLIFSLHNILKGSSIYDGYKFKIRCPSLFRYANVQENEYQIMCCIDEDTWYRKHTYKQKQTVN